VTIAALLPIPVVLPIPGATVAPLLARISVRALLVVSLLALGGTLGVLLQGHSTSTTSRRPSC
jgi:multicomponent Na+:H+ antiporter subunit D